MAKKIESGNVTKLIRHVMEKTNTSNKEIALFRKTSEGTTSTTINNGNMKTSNLIQIMESMGEKTVLVLSDGEKFELTKNKKQ